MRIRKVERASSASPSDTSLCNGILLSIYRERKSHHVIVDPPNRNDLRRVAIETFLSKKFHGDLYDASYSCTSCFGRCSARRKRVQRQRLWPPEIPVRRLRISL
ncbi:hypothetical protein RSSM_02380 [Rhodopirellula sallentina SM41]|uniref:Uncharacterized protein n=1 Tax=Rhodopirellula sallentina SM41 TaxID=1263870 RepID=M5UJJ1_9BACT|nr:hypothetical protein RSSM_02380 [Rhodopirellula sallentina SM41]